MARAYSTLPDSLARLRGGEGEGKGNSRKGKAVEGRGGKKGRDGRKGKEEKEGRGEGWRQVLMGASIIYPPKFCTLAPPMIISQ